MWKDFFYFSKGQRVGIIVLFCLIFITSVLHFILPYFSAQPASDDTKFMVEVDRFRHSLLLADSIRQKTREKENAKYYNNRDVDFTSESNNSYSLFTFNPNLIDSSVFIKLGLKPFVASNILKYRKKGGSFKTKESFGKVYGISPEKYKELEPFIIIHVPQIAQLTSDTLKNEVEKIQKITIVELNSSDTTELMQIKGIGRGYAKGIERLRKQIGGFVSIEQLHEVYGMTDDNFEKIKPFCSININLVEKIKINIASLERLNTHPYLDYYQSKAIYELRRKKGKLKKIDDLNILTEITPENRKKIQPYLSFE